MSLSQFVSKKFGKLEAASLSGGFPAAPVLKGASITSATGVTITASQLLSGCIIRTGNDDAITDRLPSAEDLIAQINILTNTQASVGMNFQTTYFLNAASATSNSTLAAGTGATLGGLATFSSGSHTSGSRVLNVIIASMVGSTGGTYLASSTL